MKYAYNIYHGLVELQVSQNEHIVLAELIGTNISYTYTGK